ncbi:phosphotransferase [Ammoniphilus sp. YIM 78166]|uniref:phosphotransferase n=1 Tax=Ammoniphilus sp. YIM 78166 TaxID=1644106 RepID=UPI00106F5D24|nr:phosphotransferase [Ammoniphilus sp. YIM 78166]
MEYDWIHLFQHEWRCQVKSVKGLRKAFYLETDRGNVYVKSYTSAAKAAWVVSLSQQMREKGLHQVLDYVYTAGGLPYLPYKGKYYVAIRSIRGRVATYANREDVLAAIRCLGDFHYHARGISGGPMSRTTSTPLLDKWEDRSGRFASIVRKLKRNRYGGSLEKKIIGFAPLIVSEAESVMDLARRSPLLKEYQKALKEQTISHRDLASHNFIVGQNTTLIDYDTAMYDTQLVDVIQMLNRVLDEQAWDSQVFGTMMNEYQRRMPFTDTQMALSYLLLRYPDNFMREVVGLYEGRLNFIPQKIEGYLTMIMKNWQERASFFRGFRHFFHEDTHRDSSIVV